MGKELNLPPVGLRSLTRAEASTFLGRTESRRRKEGWSYGELAKAAGISRVTYCRWRSGEGIQAEKALQVCDNLGIKAPNHVMDAVLRNEHLRTLVDHVRPKDQAGRCLSVGKVATYLQSAALSRGVAVGVLVLPSEPPAASVELANVCGRFVVEVEASPSGLCYYRLSVGAKGAERTLAIGRATQQGVKFCTEFLCKARDIYEGQMPKALKESSQLQDLY